MSDLADKIREQATITGEMIIKADSRTGSTHMTDREEWGHLMAEQLAALSREVVLWLVDADDNALRQSLREIMKLLDDGILVRDISRDGEPGWAIRQIPVVQTLAKAAKLIGPSAR